jgi:hypothetical protein
MRTCRTPLPLQVIHRDQIATEGKKETKETIDQVDI